MILLGNSMEQGNQSRDMSEEMPNNTLEWLSYGRKFLKKEKEVCRVISGLSHLRSKWWQLLRLRIPRLTKVPHLFAMNYSWGVASPLNIPGITKPIDTMYTTEARRAEWSQNPMTKPSFVHFWLWDETMERARPPVIYPSIQTTSMWYCHSNLFLVFPLLLLYLVPLIIITQSGPILKTEMISRFLVHADWVFTKQPSRPKYQIKTLK